MVLAKSEPAIAAHYESKLVVDEKAKELGTELRALHIGTEDAILNLSTALETLSESNSVACCSDFCTFAIPPLIA
jgi:phosphoenolpyruvate carboxylase